MCVYVGGIYCVYVREGNNYSVCGIVRKVGCGGEVRKIRKADRGGVWAPRTLLQTFLLLQSLQTLQTLHMLQVLQGL